MECLLFECSTVNFFCLQVPLGANSNKEQMSYILRKAEVSTVVCSASTLEEITKVLSECPGVKTVILMDAALNCAEVCVTSLSPSYPPKYHLYRSHMSTACPYCFLAS